MRKNKSTWTYKSTTLGLLLVGIGLSSYVEAGTITAPYEILDSTPITDDFDVTVSIPAPNFFDPGTGIRVKGGVSGKISDASTVKILLNPNKINRYFGGIYVADHANLQMGKLTIIDQSTFADENASGAGDIRTGAYGVRSDGHGAITIGSGAAIKTGQKAVLAAETEASITLGDGAYLESTAFGQGAGTVEALNGTVTVGKNSTIINDGRGMNYKMHHQAIMAHQLADHSAPAGTINIGDGSTILTYGSYENLGVVAGSMIDGAQGIVNLGKNITVKTEGKRSHGLFSALEGSKITVQSGGDIRTKGENARAVVAVRGGDIEFFGDQTIIGSNEDGNGTGPIAIYAIGNSAAEKSEVSADGKLIINGYLFSGDDGVIDLTLRDQSKLIGGALISRVGNRSGRINLTMNSGAQWEMTNYSSVSKLRFFGFGDVTFATDITNGDYRVLKVKDLSGNGHFTMRVDPQSGDRDFLNVTGTSAGTHAVTVQNDASSNVAGDEKFLLIATADGNAKFVENNTVEFGGYKYKIRDVAGSNAKEWELYGTKKASGPASVAVNTFSSDYLLNYTENQTVLQRMGKLREGNLNNDIWARTFGGKFHSSAQGFLHGYDLNYWGLQVGVDRKISLNNGKGDFYLGGMFGYSKGNLSYGNGNGNIDSKSLGVYGTYVAPWGFYTDLVVKYSWKKDDFKVLDSQGVRVTGEDLKTEGLSASLEVGQKLYLDKENKEGWYVEPQAQLSVGHQNGGTFNASNGLKVELDSYKSLLGRIGTTIGYEVKGGKNPVKVYGKISFVHEFDGDIGYSLNNSKETTSFGDSWWTYGLGATAQLGTRHNIYLDVERTEGGQFTQEWALNAGYRYSW